MEVNELPFEEVEVEEETTLSVMMRAAREEEARMAAEESQRIDLDEEQVRRVRDAANITAESFDFRPIPSATLDLVAGLRLGFAQQLGTLSQVLLNTRGLLLNSQQLPPAAQEALAEPLDSLQVALSDAYTDLGKVMWVLRP